MVFNFVLGRFFLRISSSVPLFNHCHFSPFAKHRICNSRMPFHCFVNRPLSSSSQQRTGTYLFGSDYNETEEWAERMIEQKFRNGDGNDNLDSEGQFFSDLVYWWYSNVYESTLNVHGIRLLIRIALDKGQIKGFKRRKNCIAELWECVKDTMSASDFLAFLVLEFVERDQLDEAKVFAKLLAIRGTSFTRPLRLLLWRASASENLTGSLRQNMENDSNNWIQTQQSVQLGHAQRIVEQFSAIVQECYFDAQQMTQRGGQRGRRKGQPTEDEEEEETKLNTDAMLIANSRYQSLLWLWMPNRMSRYWAESQGYVRNDKKGRKPRNSSRQMHRVDAKDVAKLGHLLVTLWAEIATKKGDAKAWDRLMDFVKHNDLPMDKKLCQLREEMDNKSDTMCKLTTTDNKNLGGK